MTEVPDIQYSVQEPVALVRLNRPERLNAFTHATLARLREAILDAERDRRVVGIVITGEGRGFCAGLDAETLSATADAGSNARGQDDQGAALPGLFTYFLEVDKPIVAAVNGVTAGGGLVMASMADVRFASTEASFTAVFGKRGLISEHGMSWILPRLVGTGFALDLLLSSRRLHAEEAQRIGLVQRICEPDALVTEACDWVRELAANVSPAAMRDTKRLVYKHGGVGYPEAVTEADEWQWQAFDRPDAREGAQSFAARRPPRFDRLGEA